MGLGIRTRPAAGLGFWGIQVEDLSGLQKFWGFQGFRGLGFRGLGI